MFLHLYENLIDDLSSYLELKWDVQLQEQAPLTMIAESLYFNASVVIRLKVVGKSVIVPENILYEKEMLACIENIRCFESYLDYTEATAGSDNIEYIMREYTNIDPNLTNQSVQYVFTLKDHKSLTDIDNQNEDSTDSKIILFLGSRLDVEGDRDEFKGEKYSDGNVSNAYFDFMTKEKGYYTIAKDLVQNLKSPIIDFRDYV